ncbi:hypothetical protein BVX95_00560 [archaeon D22]|nr:hypothetical protein BVX95_00560 [archaeon D22]
MKNRNVLILSTGFSLIFFAYSSVERYLTPYFSSLGQEKASFVILLILYIFFTLGNLFAPSIIDRYGAKKSMILGSFFYFLFIFTLPFKSLRLTTIAAALIGLGGGLLWSSQNSYIVLASDEKKHGESNGYFRMLTSFFSFLGVIIFGYLVKFFSFEIPMYIYSLFPLIGLFALTFLEDKKLDYDPLKKTNFDIRDSKLIRISLVGFSTYFIHGLVIGIVPLQIKEILGIEFIGILLSLFFLVPILLSYPLGKLSDTFGRKKSLLLSYYVMIIGLFLLFLSKSKFPLILGIIILTLNYATMRPLSAALIGDISTKKNVNIISSFFWFVQGFGIFSSLLLSLIIQNGITYIISIFTIIAILFLIRPVISNLEQTKKDLLKDTQ